MDAGSYGFNYHSTFQQPQFSHDHWFPYYTWSQVYWRGPSHSFILHRDPPIGTPSLIYLPLHAGAGPLRLWTELESPVIRQLEHTLVARWRDFFIDNQVTRWHSTLLIHSTLHAVDPRWYSTLVPDRWDCKLIWSFLWFVSWNTRWLQDAGGVFDTQRVSAISILSRTTKHVRIKVVHYQCKREHRKHYSNIWLLNITCIIDLMHCLCQIYLTVEEVPWTGAFVLSRRLRYDINAVNKYLPLPNILPTFWEGAASLRHRERR